MVSTKQQILDIAMNLNRIGNWAADGYDAKQKRIMLFLEQTQSYVLSLDEVQFSPKFNETMNSFRPVFQSLYTEAQEKPQNSEIWAEKMMTWGNILTHRTKLL